MKKFTSNIPNMLTAMRLLLMPVFVLVFFKIAPIWALAVFFVTCGTDLLDGYLARRLNCVSDFGKLFDPLADKLMQLTAVICLCINKNIALWVIIVLAAKELYMLLGSAVMLGKEKIVVYANKFGKAAAFTLNVSIGLTFLQEYIAPADKIILYIALVLTIMSMIMYTVTAIKNRNNKHITEI